MTAPADLRTHTHPANPAPLIVRLRDLAPHLGHAARARLALDRIIEHDVQLHTAHAILADVTAFRRDIIGVPA